MGQAVAVAVALALTLCPHGKSRNLCRNCYERDRRDMLTSLGLCIDCRTASDDYSRCERCRVARRAGEPVAPLSRGYLPFICSVCGDTSHRRSKCPRAAERRLARARALAGAL